MRLTALTLRHKVASILLGLFVFCFASCGGKNEQVCTLKVRWSNAYTATDSLLFLSYTDTAKTLVVDTLYLKEPKGKAKFELLVYPMGETSLSLYDARESFFIPLKGQKGREINVELDLKEPMLYEVKGYDEADLRTNLIAKHRKALLRLQHAEAEGNDSLAESLRKELEQQIALYITDNSLKPGIEAISREFFPSWRGARRYLAYTGRDTIALALTTLHHNYGFYRSLFDADHLQLPFYKLSDTIRALDKSARKLGERIFLFEMTIGNPDSARERDFEKALEADSLRRALFIISFPRDKEPITRADSLLKLSDTVINAVSKKPIASDSLVRRIVLAPFVGEWLRMSQVNVVPEFPYYFIMDGSQRLLYRTSSVDSALYVVDSLLRKTPLPETDSTSFSKIAISPRSRPH